MKNCGKCNIELIEGTRFNSDIKQGIPICKSCRKGNTNKHRKDNPERYKEIGRKTYLKYLDFNKKRNKEWLDNKADGLHHVYLLKNNYVGVTNNIYRRMCLHKHVGNPTNDYRILYSTKIRKDALELEDLLHDMGYEGKHLNNTYK